MFFVRYYKTLISKFLLILKSFESEEIIELNITKYTAVSSCFEDAKRDKFHRCRNDKNGFMMKESTVISATGQI